MSSTTRLMIADDGSEACVAVKADECTVTIER